jgi:hypothetical protein
LTQPHHWPKRSKTFPLEIVNVAEFYSVTQLVTAEADPETGKKKERVEILNQ